MCLESVRGPARSTLLPSVITSVVHDHAAPMAHYLGALDTALYTHEIEAIISPWYQTSYGNELRNRDGIYYEGRVVHTPQANGTVPQTS